MSESKRLPIIKDALLSPVLLLFLAACFCVTTGGFAIWLAFQTFIFDETYLGFLSFGTVATMIAFTRIIFDIAKHYDDDAMFAHGIRMFAASTLNVSGYVAYWSLITYQKANGQVQGISKLDFRLQVFLSFFGIGVAPMIALAVMFCVCWRLAVITLGKDRTTE